MAYGASITGTPGAAVAGTPYAYQFSVAGSPSPTVSVSAGSLPTGLTLSSTGKLSGTPTKAAAFTFTAKATNSAGSATRVVTMTVTAGAAKSLTTAAGNHQFTDVTKRFATNLQAKLTDVNGNAKTGTAVTFKVTSGSAIFAGGGTTVTATSGSNGIATASVLTAGSAVGPVVVTAMTSGTSTATFNLTVVPTADLAVSLSGPTTAANNATFTETIKVKNNGPSAAVAAITTMPIPTGVTLVSAPGAKTVKINNTSYLVWTDRSLASGTTTTYAATFRVSPSVHATVSILVGAVSLIKDTNLGNNATSSRVRLG